MSDSNITKIAFANTLKDLMTKKSFSKISVSDIVDACGLTRQAFYYHFKDKYDLMNWIYYTETARFMSNYDTVEHWTDGLKELCRYMRENKVFYINALNTTGQDSFPEYLHKYITDISIAVIESMLNDDFDHKKWGFTVDFFSTAFVGLIVKWANNGMRENPDDYVEQIRRIIDGSLFHELQNELGIDKDR